VIIERALSECINSIY